MEVTHIQIEEVTTNLVEPAEKRKIKVPEYFWQHGVKNSTLPRRHLHNSVLLCTRMTPCANSENPPTNHVEPTSSRLCQLEWPVHRSRSSDDSLVVCSCLGNVLFLTPTAGNNTRTDDDVNTGTRVHAGLRLEHHCHLHKPQPGRSSYADHLPVFP